MSRTIFALFDDALAALNVAGALERNGYDRGAISVLVADPRGRYARPAGNGEPPAKGKDGGAPGRRVFQTLDLPGLGPAAITGPLSAVLSDVKHIHGGLVEKLTVLGFEEPPARHYFESLRRGQALMSVEAAEDGVRMAVELMRRLGARAVDETETASEKAVASAAAGTPEPALAPETAITPEPVVAEEAPVEDTARTAPARPEGLLDQVTVPVVEEHLEVGKRQVNRGGVRINSHIVEHPIQENVSLREEHLTIERRPVYRDATETDLADFKEGSIEIHETVEVPVISKRRRVVEEIVVGKETRERVETISETLRKTKVSVEPLESGDASDMPSAWKEGGGRTAEPTAQHESAYRYGSALARDERYRGAKWSDVEPHARHEWEKENAGTWEQFKDAVRGAWQKVSGR